MILFLSIALFLSIIFNVYFFYKNKIHLKVITDASESLRKIINVKSENDIIDDDDWGFGFH